MLFAIFENGGLSSSSSWPPWAVLRLSLIRRLFWPWLWLLSAGFYSISVWTVCQSVVEALQFAVSVCCRIYVCMSVCGPPTIGNVWWLWQFSRKIICNKMLSSTGKRNHSWRRSCQRKPYLLFSSNSVIELLYSVLTTWRGSSMILSHHRPQPLVQGSVKWLYKVDKVLVEIPVLLWIFPLECDSWR